MTALPLWAIWLVKAAIVAAALVVIGWSAIYLFAGLVIVASVIVKLFTKP